MSRGASGARPPCMDATQEAQIATLRQKVAADPRTKAIAKALNLSVNDYAGLVAHFKVTGEEPQFMVVGDEVLEQHGLTPPTTARVESFLRTEKKVIQASGRTSSFDDLPKVRTAPAVVEERSDKAVDPALQAALKHGLRRAGR